MRILLSCLLLAASSCREPAAPLKVELYGATAIEETKAGRVYWFDLPARPRLRIDSAEGLAIRWDETPAEYRAGALLELEAPPLGRHTLEVERGRSRFRAEVEVRDAASARPEVRRIAELAEQDLQAARSALDALPRELWPWGCVELARRVPQVMRPDAYLDCARGADARGFVSEGAERRIAAIFWARQLRQLQRAGAIAEEARAAVARVGDVRLEGRLAHQEAQLARELSELRRARQQLEQAVAAADRIGEPNEALLYRMEQATVLSELGRHRDALELATAILARELSQIQPRDVASLYADAGWIQLRAYGASEERALLQTARTDLERAKRSYLEQGMGEQAANVEASLALLELRAGDGEASERAIAEARRLNPVARGVETPFLDLLEAELSLEAKALGPAQAGFMRVVEAAQLEAPGASSDYTWRARLGLARVELARGQRGAALRSLAEAGEIASRQARRTGGRADGVSFLDDRRRFYVIAVEALLGAGDAEGAWRVADEAQSLLFRALEGDRTVRLARLAPDAQAAWERQEAQYLAARAEFLSTTAPELASRAAVVRWTEERRRAAKALALERDALDEALDRLDSPREPERFERSTLAKDEALLLVFPGSRDTHWFWVSAEGVEVAHGPPSSLSERLQHLYVVAGKEEVATLRLEGERRLLIAHASVSHVPYADWLARAPVVAADRPLVVADPRRDLPHAREEAAQVITALGAEALYGDQATLSEVLARLDGRSVFHFAGHGRLAAEAPWEAHLALAKGQILDFELLLAKRPALGLVVLSGCETGVAGQIGLPEALLSAGAMAVLATGAVVEDRAAHRFIERFYRHHGATEPAAAYRAAALEAEAEEDQSWRAFRLLGRRSRHQREAER